MQWLPNKFHIYANESQQLGVFVLDPDGTPVNISGATAIELLLKKQDGSVLVKPAVSGFTWGLAHSIYVYSFDLTADETASLPMGVDQSIILKVIFGTTCRFITITKALSVAAIPFMG